MYWPLGVAYTETQLRPTWYSVSADIMQINGLTDNGYGAISDCVIALFQAVTVWRWVFDIDSVVTDGVPLYGFRM